MQKNKSAWHIFTWQVKIFLVRFFRAYFFVRCQRQSFHYIYMCRLHHHRKYNSYSYLRLDTSRKQKKKDLSVSPLQIGIFHISQRYFQFNDRKMKWEFFRLYFLNFVHEKREKHDFNQIKNKMLKLRMTWGLIKHSHLFDFEEKLRLFSFYNPHVSLII